MSGTKPLSEDCKAILRLLLDSGKPLGHLDIGWDELRFQRAIGEARAAGVRIEDDRRSH